MLLAQGGPKQASPPSRSRPYHRAGPIGARLILTADLPTCRPADLPTCRPADLPTCRPALSGCLTSVTAPKFPPPSTPRPEISPKAFPLGHACPPMAQQLSERHLRYFARCAIFFNSPFPTGNSEEPLRSYCFIQTTEFP